MFKILILVYLIGQDPVDTQKTFVVYDNFETMEECKQELLLNTRFNNTYDVLYNFIVLNDFRYDWLAEDVKMMIREKNLLLNLLIQKVN